MEGRQTMSPRTETILRILAALAAVALLLPLFV